MKAIILAAGRARRLFPITHRKPKCLLPIDGSSLIQRLVQSLTDTGVSDIVVVVGFRKDLIKRHLKSRHPDVHFTFIENPDYARTNASYSLWLAREHLTDTALYLNADVACDPAIIKDVVQHPRASVTALQQNPWDVEQVNLVTDRRKQTTEIGKHITAKKSAGEFIGVTKFGPAFSRRLVAALDSFQKNGDRNKFAADAINDAIRGGGILHALDVSDYPAHEVDTIKDYEYAKTLGL